jgi:hypothetical protein
MHCDTQLIPWELEKDTTERTIRINASPLHQMGHMLSDQEEDEK